MAATKIPASQIDWSSFSNNIKTATNASVMSLGNGSNNLNASVAVTFTVATACKALVTVHIGAQSTTDFEFQPLIFLDGTQVQALAPNAAAGNASNRATVRSLSSTVTLSAGAHTISPGVFFSSGTSLGIAATGCNISVIVLGNVTA